MEDGEGSVFIDGEDAGNEEETTSENSEESTSTDKNDNNKSEDGSEENADAEGDKSSEDSDENQDKKEEGQDDKSDKEEKSDKGTKLDDDPLSRAHQLRANAEAKQRRYEEFLNDPKKVKAYLQELEEEQGKKSETSTEETDFLKDLDPEKMKTPADVVEFAKTLKEATRKEVAQMKEQLTGMASTQQQKEMAGRIQGEISSVQTKYPELREFNADGTKNPDFNPELENLIGETYESLDFDKKTGRFRGQVSVAAIADKIMGAKKIGEGSGSRKAQTDVLDKRGGRVTTSKTSSDAQTTDESKLSPAATIAARMSRVATRK